MKNDGDPSARSPVQVSFRDPSGCLAVAENRVLRAVNAQGRDDCKAFMASEAGRQLLADLDVIPTRSLSLSEDGNHALAQDVFRFQPALLLEHDRIPFSSYPYEWPPEMLHAAGTLTLRIARMLLRNDLGLKDATPFNVLFLGPKPIFIDVLSFERRDGGNPIWLPEAQFVSAFLLPLLVYKHHQIFPHQHFAARRDGIPPEDVFTLTSMFRRFAPSFLRWVSLPTLLGRKGERPQIVQRKLDPSKSRFILGYVFRQLEASLKRLAPKRGRRSTWSGYESCTHYDRAASKIKEEFVAVCLDRVRPTRVLDVGCNVGRFSRIAARKGAGVIAIDLDPVVVGEVWHMARQETLDILPLVQNLSVPSPAIGWRNRECPSFLERAERSFQMVFLLAVIHHLLVTDRIPLDEIVELIARLSSDAVVVEYVGPEDDMFRRIARGRERLHAGLTPESFEDAWKRRFELVDSRAIPGTSRKLYLFAKGTSPSVTSVRRGAIEESRSA